MRALLFGGVAGLLACGNTGPDGPGVSSDATVPPDVRAADAAADGPVRPTPGLDAGAESPAPSDATLPGSGERPPLGPAAGAPPMPAPPLGRTLDYTPPAVVISELMYHAVLEPGGEEQHEFIELYNRTDAAVPLGGWQFSAGVTFTFPAGTSIPPRGHIVVAKDPARLAAVWGAPSQPFLGPYTGELDNGGEVVALADATGAVVEQVRYDDTFPWPIGADALGAGEAWLRGENVPLARHALKGRSLERISFEVSPQEPVNWTASPLDGATPGKPNATPAAVQAIAEQVIASREDGSPGPVAASGGARIRVAFSARGAITSPQVEYFVDDLEATGESRQRVPLAKAGDGWEAILPAQRDDSIVRYRVLGDRGMGAAEVIAPRPSDPFEWFGYAVTPGVGGTTPVLRLYVKKADWTRMYTNVTAGRVPAGSCALNPTYNDRVPAVLVSEGRVADVMVRYHGSPFNRTAAGVLVKSWPAAEAPGAPSPLLAFSWRISLPRYAPLDGRRDLILHKRANECSGAFTTVGGAMMERAGIPSSRASYVRVFVNGQYYHYMTDLEHPGEQLLARFFGKDHVVGDLFKVVGYNVEQGPYTVADGRQLTAACDYTVEQRYDHNYERKLPDWKQGSREVQELVEALHAARAAGPDALRAYFTERFDYPLMLGYMAVRAWLAPWDDAYQNHFMYRRSDGKWMFLPWDFDKLFGGWNPPNASFYVGEIGDRSNPMRKLDGTSEIVTYVNHFADAFIKTFRDDLNARLKALVANELATSALHALIDEHAAQYVGSEAAASSTAAVCDMPTIVTRMKNFVRDRNARVTAGQFK